MNGINRIDREELKTKLDRGEKMKLVMTMNEWAYNAAHIPGSVYINSAQEALTTLSPDEEIVVYCTGLPCPISMQTYYLLKRKGFRNVREYAGGLVDWEAAGYPLEGNMAGRLN